MKAWKPFKLVTIVDDRAMSMSFMEELFAIDTLLLSIMQGNYHD